MFPSSAVEECPIEAVLLVMMTPIAPPRPRISPMSLLMLNLSIPITIDITSTMIGVRVEIIEPSMGVVSDREYINIPLRSTAIIIEPARIDITSSRRTRSYGSHRRGTSDMRAETIIVAVRM